MSPGESQVGRVGGDDAHPRAAGHGIGRGGRAAVEPRGPGPESVVAHALVDQVLNGGRRLPVVAGRLGENDEVVLKVETPARHRQAPVVVGEQALGGSHGQRRALAGSVGIGNGQRQVDLLDADRVGHDIAVGAAVGELDGKNAIVDGVDPQAVPTLAVRHGIVRRSLLVHVGRGQGRAAVIDRIGGIGGMVAGGVEGDIDLVGPGGRRRETPGGRIAAVARRRVAAVALVAVAARPAQPAAARLGIGGVGVIDHAGGHGGGGDFHDPYRVGHDVSVGVVGKRDDQRAALGLVRPHALPAPVIDCGVSGATAG